jgi:hypothetical protein
MINGSVHITPSEDLMTVSAECEPWFHRGRRGQETSSGHGPKCSCFWKRACHRSCTGQSSRPSTPSSISQPSKVELGLRVWLRGPGFKPQHCKKKKREGRKTRKKEKKKINQIH